MNTSVAPRVVEAPRPRIEPIDAVRHSVKFTVGAEFMAELNEVKAALSHLVPDGNLEAVLRLCMQKTLDDCARRQRADVKAPRETIEGRMKAKRKKLTRYVTAAVRRAVWKRDGGRCTFVGPDGKRCGSTFRLQLDHLRPHAWGGEATIENLALRCAVHNLHRAREHFGAAHMSKFTRKVRPPHAPGVHRNDTPEENRRRPVAVE